MSFLMGSGLLQEKTVQDMGSGLLKEKTVEDNEEANEKRKSELLCQFCWSRHEPIRLTGIRSDAKGHFQLLLASTLTLEKSLKNSGFYGISSSYKGFR